MPRRLIVSKLELSDTTEPPPYDATSTTTALLSFGARIRCRLPTETMPSRGPTLTTVLALICDIVTAPDYIPSAVVSIIHSCATALSASEFSDLLQSLNVRGHTAMYWAIINDRREALSTFVGFISKISLVCFDDLRLACMVTSDHTLFMQLGLEREISLNNEPLSPSSGYSSYVDREIEVADRGGADENFSVLLHFKRCQRRLRAMENVSAEFVARGRLWWLCIYYEKSTETWCMRIGLSHPSIPVRRLEITGIIKERESPCHATWQSKVQVPQGWSGLTMLAAPPWV